MQNYTVTQKSITQNSWRQPCEFLTNFQNSFNDGKRSKFQEKPIKYFPPYLPYAATLPSKI